MIPDLTGKSVLDVGCGSGRYSEFFLSRGAWRLVGVDLNRENIEFCRENYRGAFLLGPVEKVIEGRFDFIFCRDLFHSLPPQRKKELFNFLLAHLEKGGTLLFNEYKLNTRWFDVFYKILTAPWRVDQLLHRIFVGHFRSGSYFYAGVNFYFDLCPALVPFSCQFYRTPEIEIERNWQSRLCDWLVGGHRLWIKVTRI